MYDSRFIIKKLQEHLRAKNLTYADVGSAIGLSIPSVKRLFSGKCDVPIQRLERICVLADIRLSDLVRDAAAAEKDHDIHELSPDEELFFSERRDLLAILYFLGIEPSLKKLMSKYQMSRPKTYSRLRELERRNYLTLLPGDRVKLLIPPIIKFPYGGLFAKELAPKTKTDFFDSHFSGANELAGALMPILTQESIDQIRVKLHDLMEFVRFRHNLDELTPRTKIAMGIFFGFRPWDWPYEKELAKYL